MRVDTTVLSMERFQTQLTTVVENNKVDETDEKASPSKPLALRIIAKLWDRKRKYYVELPGRFVSVALASGEDVSKVLDCVEGLFRRIEQDGLDQVWARLVPQDRLSG